MKKIVLILTTVIMLISTSLTFASGSQHSTERPNFPTETISEESVENKVDDVEEVTPATDKILSNMSKKDRKIAEYTDKYNDKTYAYTAYYLDLIQLYSIPVCIIGITIGAFNFYIIGEKKLDKKEQGFGFIMAFLCGLVFFQVLPFVFALLVAGK